MALKPLMSGWCAHPSGGEVDSHTRCKGYNTANPGKEWQPCPCLCHMGDEYQCGNCGRVIMEAPMWRPLVEGEDATYVHVIDGRGVGEECPPGGKPPVVEYEVEDAEAERHPDYCTFAGKTYDETNGQPSNCLCPPEGGWPEPETIDVEIDTPTKSKKKKKGKDKKKKKKGKEK